MHSGEVSSRGRYWRKESEKEFLYIDKKLTNTKNALVKQRVLMLVGGISSLIKRCVLALLLFNEKVRIIFSSLL
jgi:hypothetical protein